MVVSACPGGEASELVRGPSQPYSHFATAGLCCLVLVASNNQALDISVAAATYHRALEKLLWCVAIGMLAMIAIAASENTGSKALYARAIGYGILIAGATFISGVLLGYLFGLRPTGVCAVSGPGSYSSSTNTI